MEDLLSRQFENVIEKMSRIKKEDLKKVMPTFDTTKQSKFTKDNDPVYHSQTT